MPRNQVLFVDDDSQALLALTRTISSLLPNVAVSAASNVDKGLELALQIRAQVAVVDLSIVPAQGVESGFGLIRKLREQIPTCRIIVMTGHDTAEYGVQALNLGAASFLGKPVEVPHLAALIRDGIAQSELRSAYHELSNERVREGEQLLSAYSPRMREVLEELRYAAHTTQAVLISGETGTGKSICAQLLHALSSRSAGPFVRYQPNYSNTDLVNSDLFGHARGAFTGASENRAGLIAEAWGGTLFLDEVDELPKETQVALLGVLQDKRYRAVGSSNELEANFRLVCATNCDVRQAVEQGKLRRDFFHRIAHFEIRLPALREREQDLSALSAELLRRLSARENFGTCTMSEEALARLRAHTWPGNVRELEAVLEGALFRAQFRGESIIRANDIQPSGEQHSDEAGDFHSAVSNFKLTLIRSALHKHAGNQVKAAQELGLDRSTMRRFLARSA